MKDLSKKIAKTILISTVAVGVATATTHTLAATKKEKCYGIVKKGKNDCGAPGHACQGQATKSGSPKEWMYVLKGNCKRIVGGRLQPPGKDKM